MQIEGEIVSIIFRNESNGYTVARLLHNNAETIVVGNFFQIAINENVRLNGKFVANKKYGDQFVFDTFEMIYPTSVISIKKFLESGLIKGVGPATSNLIVSAFGKDSLDIIEFNPEKLTKIKGISKDKADKINKSLTSIKESQSTIIFLNEFDITFNLALKIYKQFKGKTIKTLQANPYCLVEFIDGIGFIKADKIAVKMGIAKNSEFRVRAGILHSLNEASEKNGHTFLPYEKLIENLSKLLALNAIEYSALFDKVLQILTIEKIIFRFFKEYQTVVMLAKFFYFEKFVADKTALLNISVTTEQFDINQDIKHFKKLNSIKFHSEQINAIQTAVNSGVCIITGGPGTGKTTIIKCILSILDSQGKRCALLAPTGRASKRMSEATGKEASTIHRALQLEFSSGRFGFNDSNPLPFNAIIVDEFSMVDISLAYNLLKAMSRDCKLIMVGDKDQLPSVGAGNVLDDIIKSGVIPVAQLTQIFRQEENSLIITNAHKINQGEMPEFDNKSTDFFFESKLEPEEIKNNIVNMVTNRIPEFLNIEPTQIQVLAPLKSGLCGTENLNKELQKRINPPSTIKPEIIYGDHIFRQGDKVMQISNNYNLEWTKTYENNLKEDGLGVFNGDIGYIQSINKSTGETYVKFDDGKVCLYPRTELSQLFLAYAVTIHKSQGSEFDVVIIPAISGPSIILNRNLIYTAVTRAKKMVVLVGEKKYLRRMIANKFLLKRFTMLKTFLIESNRKTRELFE
ncbi:MAG: ATP-dependent RecD-like DNA helicase [Clostridia bacterium]|nr:ATP-dependent RecD-like DNA helicase [Clostridia bacterium]